MRGQGGVLLSNNWYETRQTELWTNCATLLADLFLYSYKADLMQKLLHEKKRSLAVVNNWTFRYIDDVLFINDYYIHLYVDSIYPYELTIY
jgi:hypothetical protein